VGSGLMFALFVTIQWKMGDQATLPFSILLQRSIVSGALYLLALAIPTYVVSLLEEGFTKYVNIWIRSMAFTSRFTSNLSKATLH
jgi:hypothetical protein